MDGPWDGVARPQIAPDSATAPSPRPWPHTYTSSTVRASAFPPASEAPFPASVPEHAPTPRPTPRPIPLVERGCARAGQRFARRRSTACGHGMGLKDHGGVAFRRLLIELKRIPKSRRVFMVFIHHVPAPSAWGPATWRGREVSARHRTAGTRESTRTRGHPPSRAQTRRTW